MKHHFLAALLFLFPLAAGLVQAGDQETPAELTQLRRDYLASLKQLLGKISAAPSGNPTPVALEIDRITNLLEVSAPSTPPCGMWAWHHNATTKAINNDGTVGRNHKEGAWHWIDKAARSLQIEWAEGWVDKLTLAEDGQTMNVINSLGDRFTVRLIPQVNGNEPPEAP